MANVSWISCELLQTSYGQHYAERNNKVACIDWLSINLCHCSIIYRTHVWSFVPIDRLRRFKNPVDIIIWEKMILKDGILYLLERRRENFKRRILKEKVFFNFSKSLRFKKLNHVLVKMYYWNFLFLTSLISRRRFIFLLYQDLVEF